MSNFYNQFFKSQIDRYCRKNNVTIKSVSVRLGILPDTLYKYRLGVRRIPKPVLLALEYITDREIDFKLKEKS